MRAQLIGAVLAAALACGAAEAQTPPKAAPATAAGKNPGEKAGAAAAGDQMVEDFLADLEPIDVQVERAKRDAVRRQILEGKSGPFLQIKVAWEEREWPPLLYGVGLIMLWAVGAIFAVWLISAIVQKVRGER